MVDNSKIRLVLIDDQIAVIALMKASLSALGYQALESARSGEEGLKVINLFKPHAVVCDINMPGMNGLEVLKHVRTGKSGAPRGLPFIFLTGHSESGVVQTALALDANGFIRKPVAPKDLNQRLQRIIAEPQPVKDDDAYASILIPEVHMAGIKMPTLPPPQSREGTEAEIKSLVEGAELAVGIETVDGRPLVKAGVKITAQMRDKLSDLVEIGLVSPTTRIVVPPEV